jgi:endonuclease/exonuclease/phosphatase family metal-dependent hydrolase
MLPNRFRYSNLKLILVVLTITLGLISGTSCAVSSLAREELLPETENYTDGQSPIYTGRYAPPVVPPDEEVVVVTYNLRFGEEIEAAAAAFAETTPLNEADILLLQEMDETGTADLARRLGFNYVYYPASVAPDGDNFGNAILSRWPLSDPQKLILPGLHPLTRQQRTATRATVRVGDRDILVYAAHLEVATAPPSLRADQVKALLADIPNDAPHVIVGGDFNTVTGLGVTGLSDQFEEAYLDHHSDGLGPTFTRFGLRPSATDHIFSRGFRQKDAGVLAVVAASDHFPVWARLVADP